MTKVIMHGCNGHMGQVITRLISEEDDIEIVAGIDINTVAKFTYPVFADLKDCYINADVIIDFASVKAIDSLLNYVSEKKVPVVLCTTGLSKSQLEKVAEISKETAILKSANMSLGINTLLKLVKVAAKVFSEASFDMEIVEKHHNKKLDAPSGTALALADAINEALQNEYFYKFDRSQDHAKRDKKEIGISTVRGGTIVGEHEVIFAGEDEVIEFKHTAYSKTVFAKGAIQAAKFLSGKPAGMYDMSDVIG